MNSNSQKVYAMIPARYGSTRLKLKNLALINDKPMISYPIVSAIDSNVFEKVVVNSEHKIFEKIAKKYKADFYHRETSLGSSSTKSDTVVYDFMVSNPKADIVAWINPTSPFQSKDEINKVVNYFIDNNLDSLITVENKYVHCYYNNKPVNFNKSTLFAQTQDLEPVQSFVYSVMIWRSKKFIEEYEKNGQAFFCGSFGVYPVDKLTGIIIKTAEDLKIADFIMRSMDKNENYKVQYDDIVNIK